MGCGSKGVLMLYGGQLGSEGGPRCTCCHGKGRDKGGVNSLSLGCSSPPVGVANHQQVKPVALSIAGVHVEVMEVMRMANTNKSRGGWAKYPQCVFPNFTISKQWENTSRDLYQYLTGTKEDW